MNDLQLIPKLYKRSYTAMFAIQRRDAIQAAFETLLAIVDEVFPITQRDLQRAKEIVLGSRALSARDALHLAVMEHNSVENILTFD